MGIDVRTDEKASQRDDRRRGGLMLVLAFISAPVGFLGWMTLGLRAGLFVYGVMIATLVLLWCFSFTQTSKAEPRDR